MVAENCDLNNESYSKLGDTFALPHFVNAEEASKHLAGEVQFKITEIEVYALSWQANSLPYIYLHS